jgi:hypothetical protein
MAKVIEFYVPDKFRRSLGSNNAGRSFSFPRCRRSQRETRNVQGMGNHPYYEISASISYGEFLEAARPLWRGDNAPHNCFGREHLKAAFKIILFLFSLFESFAL